jgi:hypothetical protein
MGKDDPQNKQRNKVDAINIEINELLNSALIESRTTFEESTYLELIATPLQDNIPPNYPEIIQRLTRSRDEEIGIKWKIGQDVIIRDARARDINAEDKLQQRDLRSYQIQLINSIRAAELLIKTSSLEEISKHELLKVIRSNLKKFPALEDYATNKELNRQVTEMNTELVSILKSEFNITLNEAQNRLNKAKEFVSFEDRHYSIATIHEVDNRIFSEIDIPLTDLSQEQQEEFEILKTRSWFQILPKWEQDIIQEMKEKITDGKHNCPTQLRELPLIKNGYHKFIQEHDDKERLEDSRFEKGGLKESEDYKESRLLDSHFHSGTHRVSVGKGDSADFTKEEREAEELRLTNMVKTQHQMVAGDKLQIIGLLSPLPLIDGENRNVSILGQTFENNYNNLPTNIGRMILPNISNGIEATLTNIANAINTASVPNYGTFSRRVPDASLPKLQSHIRGEKILTNKELEEITNELPNTLLLEKEIIVGAAKIRLLTSKRFLGLDSSNRNLELATRFENLSNLMNDFHNHKKENRGKSLLNSEKLIRPEICIECKSGKGRTGVVEINILAETIAQETGKNKQDILRQIAFSSNAVFESGLGQGGTAGCFGIKKAASSVIPSSWDISKAIILPTAENDNIKVNKKFLDVNINYVDLFDRIKKFFQKITPKNIMSKMGLGRNDSVEYERQDESTPSRESNPVRIEEERQNQNSQVPELSPAAEPSIASNSTQLSEQRLPEKPKDTDIVSNDIRDQPERSFVNKSQNQILSHSPGKELEDEKLRRDVFTVIKYVCLLLLAASVFMSGGMAFYSILLVGGFTVYNAREDQSRAENRIDAIKLEEKERSAQQKVKKLKQNRKQDHTNIGSTNEPMQTLSNASAPRVAEANQLPTSPDSSPAITRTNTIEKI